MNTRKPKTKRVREIIVSDPSLTIREFCDAEGIGRNTYYNLKAAGRGPREIRLGRAVRITQRARAEWRKARENPGKQEAAEARAQQARDVALASRNAARKVA